MVQKSFKYFRVVSDGHSLKIMITNHDLKGRSYVDLVDRRKQNRSLKDYIDDLFSGWLNLVLIQLRIC